MCAGCVSQMLTGLIPVGGHVLMWSGLVGVMRLLMRVDVMLWRMGLLVVLAGTLAALAVMRHDAAGS